MPCRAFLGFRAQQGVGFYGQRAGRRHCEAQHHLALTTPHTQSRGSRTGTPGSGIDSSTPPRHPPIPHTQCRRPVMPGRRQAGAATIAASHSRRSGQQQGAAADPLASEPQNLSSSPHQVFRACSLCLSKQQMHAILCDILHPLGLLSVPMLQLPSLMCLARQTPSCGAAPCQAPGGQLWAAWWQQRLRWGATWEVSPAGCSAWMAAS